MRGTVFASPSAVAVHTRRKVSAPDNVACSYPHPVRLCCRADVVAANETLMNIAGKLMVADTVRKITPDGALGFF